MIGVASKKHIVIMSFIAAGALWLLYAVLCDGDCVSVCPSRLLFSFPCPGCGTTRAALLLVTGKVRAGVVMNPNALLLMLFSLAYVMMLVADKAKGAPLGVTFDKIVSRTRSVLIPLLVILEAVVWIKNILM